jgi:hypothetical protein
MKRLLPALGAGLLVLCLASSLRALELRPKRTSPLDLEVKGLVRGLGPGQSGYLSWADIASLPKSKLKITGEFIPGEQEVTVVYLADLLKALPVDPKADTVLGTCVDGFAAVFPKDFIAHYRPFIVLEIAGKPSSAWPPPGITYNPGPYPITVSARVAPDAASYRDIEHKKPWGIGMIKLVSYAEEFKAVYTGPYAHLSAGAADGREIWINSCLCCHAGPASLFAGVKADRPYEVLVAYALYKPTYFKSYVRNPQDEASCAQMEAHPHYSDAELQHIIDFIVAGLPKT